MQANEKVTVAGLPSFQAEAFSGFAGELTVRLTVVYKGTTYANLPILRLAIERYGDVVHVNDDYTGFIPYLKPVEAFRTYIYHWLNRFLVDEASLTGIIADGVRVYLEDMRKYSNAKSLIRQAKTRVSDLSEKRPDAERQARETLKVLGVTPNTDVAFEIRS